MKLGLIGKFDARPSYERYVWNLLELFHNHSGAAGGVKFLVYIHVVT